MGIETASADEMLQYERDCIDSGRLTASINLDINSMMEVVALADVLKVGIWNSSRDFLVHVEGHSSSSAWADAIAYRLQNSLLEQLNDIYRAHTGLDGCL